MYIYINISTNRTLKGGKNVRNLMREIFNETCFCLQIHWFVSVMSYSLFVGN